MSKTGSRSRESQTIHNVVLGTAGHIDHGKTTLLHRLTGVDADRLPEEKERGMTIDLGFAPYALPGGARVGLIDVPGHERFIKNMVAGASGIDLVLLVVAADDGVMPQTREHLEIMQLLGLKRGIVVVNKIDLVDEELRELAVEDIRDTVRGTFLEDSPVIAVSATTGEGFEDFVDTLHAEIEQLEPRSVEGLFRMPVQRVFSARGFGTVLTGVPLSGSATIGDTVEVLPVGARGRVRGVQAYMGEADRAQAGQSSALNIADVDYKTVHRGMVAASPGHFASTTMVEVRLRYLDSHSRPLRHLSRVRFHCGTSEVLGTLYLLEKRVVEPGETTYAQVRLEDRVVVVPGDRYILRLHSPMVTLGGGEILDRSRWRLKLGKSFVIDHLKRKESTLDSPRERVLNILRDHAFEAVPADRVGVGSGLPPETVRTIVEELLEEGVVRRASRGNSLYHEESFEEGRARLRRAAAAFFEANPRRLLQPKLELRRELHTSDLFFQDLLAELERQGEAVSVRGEFLRWSFHVPKLSEKESDFRDKLLEALRKPLFAPPKLEDVAEKESFDLDRAESIAQLLREEGEIVKLADGVLMHREAIEQGRERLREHLEKEGQMTASTAKNLLESSRRYIIPLLEFYDSEGLTIRRGDLRELRKTH